MNERSSVARSIGSGRARSVRRLVRSMLTTRGSRASRSSSWPRPDIDGVDDPRAARQQHVGEAAGRGAGVQAGHARRDRRRTRRAPPPACRRARDAQRGPRDDRDRASAVDQLTGLQRAAAGAGELHLTGQQERLGGGAARRQPAIDEELIEADPRHAGQAALALDGSPGGAAAGASRPSASRTWARMPGTSIRCWRRRSSTAPWCTKPSASATFSSGHADVRPVERIEHAVAEAAHRGALLGGHHQAPSRPPAAAISASSSGFAQRALITVDAEAVVALQRLGHVKQPLHDRSEPDQQQVAAGAQHLAAPDLERLAVPIGQVLAGVARVVQADRPGVAQGGHDHVAQLLLVLRRADHQVRQGPLRARG